MIHPFTRAGLGQPPFRVKAFYEKRYQACPGAPVQVGGSCDYCGTGIALVYRIVSADGREFEVGSTCVEKTADVKLIEEMKREKRAARQAVREQERAERRELQRREAEESARRLLAKHPDLAEALEMDHPIIRDIAHRFGKFGSLSDAQIRLVFKLANEMIAEAERKSKEPEPSPVKPGKRSITGTVLSTKTQDGYAYGTLEHKMLVLTDDGEKLWGSVPRSILRELERMSDLRNQRVAFNANVERSRDDPYFGFFKRPTKAVIL